jgi:hypothetical protein
MTPIIIWAIAFALVIAGTALLLYKAGEFKNFKARGKWSQ